MGYTHYWSFKRIKGVPREELEKKYQQAIRECSAVVKRYYKDNGGISGFTAHTPVGKYGGLKFNGKGEEGHEDFTMREHFSQNLENNGFGFCKTARKEYDILVVACLSILKYRLGEAISISSDGGREDWADGVIYARHVLRRKIKMPESISPRQNQEERLQLIQGGKR